MKKLADAPSQSPVEAEPVAWRGKWRDKPDWHFVTLKQGLAEEWDRTTLEGEIAPLYASPPALLDKAVEALDALYEWYDRDGSVGGASAVFEAQRTALSDIKGR